MKCLSWFIQGQSSLPSAISRYLYSRSRLAELEYCHIAAGFPTRDSGSKMEGPMSISIDKSNTFPLILISSNFFSSHTCNVFMLTIVQPGTPYLLFIISIIFVYRPFLHTRSSTCFLFVGNCFYQRPDRRRVSNFVFSPGKSRFTISS